jgi:hypothetical protein
VQNAPSKRAGEPQEEPVQYPWRELYAPANLPNWALALVAALAGYLAYRTLRAIKRQADLMKEQSDLMVEKERAKLRIELKPFRPVRSGDQISMYMVTGSVSIYGFTEAFVERSQIYACVGYDEMINPLPEWFFQIGGLPQVIRSGAPPVEFESMVISTKGPASDKELLPVREKNAPLFCKATIEYSDAFGQKWVLRLRQRFEFIFPSLSPDALGSWMDDGPPEENGEFKREFQKPN